MEVAYTSDDLKNMMDGYGKYLSPMVQSVTYDRKRNKLISPKLLNIITKTNFTSISKLLINSDYINFILNSEAVISKIIQKRRAIFDTSQSDRLVIIKILNWLQISSVFHTLQATKEKHTTAINKLEKTYLRSNELKTTISNCESIKRKRVERCCKSLPGNLETICTIFSSHMPNYKSADKELVLFKVLSKRLYQESRLYKKALPEYINSQKISFYRLTQHFSLLELMQMTPTLHTIYDDNIGKFNLFDVIPVNHFQSIQTLNLKDTKNFWTFSYLAETNSLKDLNLHVEEWQITDSTIRNRIRLFANTSTRIYLYLTTCNKWLTKEDVINSLNMKNLSVTLYYRATTNSSHARIGPAFK